MTTGETPPRPTRPLPELDELTRAYWTSGSAGGLVVQRCRACGWYLGPPTPVCRRCRGRDLAFEPVSGRGHVYSYTVNQQPWLPDFPPPYVIAVVELAEQEGLRVVSNVVDCDAAEVSIGMPVSVAFVEQADVSIPVFRPETPPAVARQ